MLDLTENVTQQSYIDAVIIGPTCKLRLCDIKKVAFKNFTATLHQDTYDIMKSSYDFLKSYVANRTPIYGINTQFGDQVNMLDRYMEEDDLLYYGSISARQRNLIKSHNCGMGMPVASEIIKVTMLLRAHCLAQGYSGINHNIVETILACLNAEIIPIVLQYGSIGASGDLIPLAAIAAAIIGEKDVNVQYKGTIMPALRAFTIEKLEPVTLEMREGLAMINGTSFMTAIASIALCNLERLFKQMLISIAMALESMMVIGSAYHPLVHDLKHHIGQKKINKFLLEFWEGSKLISNLDELRKHNSETSRECSNKRAIQDYYSLRSVAQGFGPFQENIERAIMWIENEINSVNDNPIVDVLNKQIHHSANFMGYYVTDACDILKIDIGQASTWIHALIANLVHPRKNNNLPANLVQCPEKHNGFRPLQLLAASLAVQNRKLAQCHQSFHLPTEGDNQDVNSLGTHAAFDLRQSVENLERLTAILLLASVQALELRGIDMASIRAQTICKIIRNYSATISDCRVMRNELDGIVGLLRSEKI
jgi:histidine ammonia-lyase